MHEERVCNITPRKEETGEAMNFAVHVKGIELVEKVKEETRSYWVAITIIWDMISIVVFNWSTISVGGESDHMMLHKEPSEGRKQCTKEVGSWMAS